MGRLLAERNDSLPDYRRTDMEPSSCDAIGHDPHSILSKFAYTLEAFLSKLDKYVGYLEIRDAILRAN